MVRRYKMVRRFQKSSFFFVKNDVLTEKMENFWYFGHRGCLFSIKLSISQIKLLIILH